MKPLKNTPKVKLGIVGVSRDCFPIELARQRLKLLLHQDIERELQWRGPTNEITPNLGWVTPMGDEQYA